MIHRENAGANHQPVMCGRRSGLVVRTVTAHYRCGNSLLRFVQYKHRQQCDCELFAREQVALMDAGNAQENLKNTFPKREIKRF